MPTIFESNDLARVRTNGTNITILADRTMLGSDALQVERIQLDVGAESLFFNAVDVERFIYVIHGKGLAKVGNQVFPLERESVLWFETEDSFSLEAGTESLEILLCSAPSGE